MKEKVFISSCDYTVSHENFDLIQNEEFGFLETKPKPNIENLSAYYESEDYISHTDSKKTFVDRIYQKIKKINIDKKYKLISSFDTSQKILLDIGCGTGDFIKKCNDENWKVFGVEPNKKAIKLSQSKLGIKDSQSQLFENLELLVQHHPDQKYDVITLWHVLEHVYDLEKTIEIITNYLNENGKIIIAVPNFKSYDAQYYKNYWAAYDVPRHLWHFSQSSIHKLFSKFNFKVQQTLPMLFDSFYVSLLSEKYKFNKRNLFGAFLIGLKSNLSAKRTGEYSSLIYVLEKSKK